ncbi:response regulator [Lachnoclostridium sp.]|uniref:response regulator n=1 Tax=Lachnoclostridium sp. TaxID=2028282 RepID=UPI00289D407E|nr:response regulator [Lachnoclostridium sp.]
MYRVLLVDDEDLARESISRCIKWSDLGLSLVGTCKNGKEAILFVTEHEVDIVLTDICMPYLDGMELSKFLYENHKDIKIVILSGFHEFEYAKQAMRYKVVEYLLKPVTAQELRDVLINLTNDLNKNRKEQQEITIMKQEYNKSLTLVKGQVLSDLMLQGNPSEQLKTDLQRLEIHIEDSNLRVVSFMVTSFESDEPKQSALILITIVKIIETTIKDYKDCIVFQGVDNGIYLIFHTSKKRNLEDKLHQILNDIKKNIEAAMSFHIQIGMGGWVHGIHNLTTSFEEAKRALSYRYLDQNIYLWEMDKIKMVDKVAIYEYLENFQTAIKGNDKEGIKKLVEQLQTEFYIGYLDKNRILLYLQRIILLTRKLLEEADMKNNSQIPKENDILEQISKAPYLEQAMKLLQNYLNEIACQLSIGKESNNEKLVAQAKAYLNKHYSNPNLSLSILCQELLISPSYFSSIYKASTGETFLDTLNQIRLEQAKLLLRNTNLKNYEVALKVGFSDPHYFNIAFKKATKMTPKEFAKRND